MLTKLAKECFDCKHNKKLVQLDTCSIRRCDKVTQHRSRQLRLFGSMSLLYPLPHECERRKCVEGNNNTKNASREKRSGYEDLVAEVMDEWMNE